MANDFLVFGGGAGANVISQVTYSGLAARTAGFSSGVAQSAQLNKVWRQSSIMSAVLAQFISDRTGLDVLDDGTTATILANLKAAAAAVNGDATKTFSVAAATAANHAVNRAAGDARWAALAGLASQAFDVAAGANLASALSANEFLSVLTWPGGYFRVPVGYGGAKRSLIFCWGQAPGLGGGSGTGVTFPVTFPNAFLTAGATFVNTDGASYAASGGYGNPTASGMTVFNNGSSAGSAISWYAIGY